MTKHKHIQTGLAYHWHPGRFRVAIPVIGKPCSEERAKNVRLVELACDENEEIGRAERARLIADYLALPEKL